MYFSDLMIDPRIEEDSLRSSGLSCVDMSTDTEVSDVFEVFRDSHKK